MFNDGRRKWGYEKVKYFVEIESESNCKLLSTEYFNTKTKLQFQCKCENDFIATFEKFKDRNKRLCNDCSYRDSRDKQLVNYGEIKNFIEIESKSGCKLLSDKYDGVKKDLLLRCECGNKYFISFDKFKHQNKRQCNECGNKVIGECLRKTNEQFVKEVYDLVGDEYNVISVYKSSKDRVKIKHNKCGHIWNITPSSFLSGGSRCPKCASSKGEKIIYNWLKENNITYKSQFQYKDCKNIKPLPFDFYLPNYNLLIEYDGEQHYMPVNFGGTSNDKALSNYKRQQKHDNIKNVYCLKNNIPLLRIPYTEFDNISSILSKEIKKYIIQNLQDENLLTI